MTLCVGSKHMKCFHIGDNNNDDDDDDGGSGRVVNCCYYISLLPGCLDDRHRNPNINHRDNLDGYWVTN